MRGRKKTYLVNLESTELANLRRLASAHTSPQAEVRRARILLTCHGAPEASDEQVANLVGCSPETARKWRKRWCETRSVKDMARSGRPRAFSP